jgi:hypothetical protein
MVAKRVGLAAGPMAAKKALKAQQQRINIQKELVHLIAIWAGHQKHLGYTDRSIHKQFYLYFRRTITEALSEPSADMIQTMDELKEMLPKSGPAAVV